MRLKHILYIVTMACALSEIGMALYAMHWGNVIKEITLADQRMPDSEMLVLRALNIVLPVGLACIALLLYTWRADSIGGFALFVVGVLHFAGFDLNVRAVKRFYGENTPLANVAWWAPAPERQAAPEIMEDNAS